MSRSVLKNGLSIFAFIILVHLPATAETHKAKTLSDQNIRDFIHDITNRANETKRGASINSFINFLDEHLHTDAFFKTTIQYTIPGFPEGKNRLTLDKAEFIDSITSSEDIVNSYDAEIKINSVKISKNKKNATIKSISYEQGQVNVPNHGMVDIIGQSTCTQIIRLSAKDILQVYSANCDTKMGFDK